jgi:hypothetical protein
MAQQTVPTIRVAVNTSLIYIVLLALSAGIIYICILYTGMAMTPVTALYCFVGFVLLLFGFTLFVRFLGGRALF